MARRLLLFMTIFLFLFINNLFAEKTIGVSAFKNLTGDKSLTWLEVGIAESISAKLRNVKDYTVVDRINVDKVVSEISLNQSGLMDDKTAKKAGKAIGADIIVVGSFQKYGNQIRITASLVEVESHKILKQVIETGKMDDIFDLQDNIALKIISESEVRVTTEEKQKVVQKFTTNVSAYEYYVKGLENILTKLDYLKAIEMFNKAIEIDRNYSLAYAGLGKAYSLRSWELRNYYNKTDPSLMEKSFAASKKALEISPNLDEAHLALAKYYQEADEKKYPNKWRLCEEETRKALEINPNNGDALFLMSRIYAYDDAKEEDYLLQAIKKNGFLTDAYNNLGVIYLDAGRLDQAEQSFKKATEIDPEFKTGYMNLGVVYDRRNQLEKALEMYQIVLKKYPTYPLGLMNLGIGYRRLDKLNEAMDAFQRAVKVKPEYADVWGEIGYINLLLGDKETAKKNTGRANSYYKEGIKNYLVSLKYDPKYKYSLANIGYCYTELGDYNTAISYLKKAAEYHPTYAWPCGHMGWIYRYKLKDNMSAKLWYAEAAKRDPNNSKFRQNLMELQ